MNHLQLCEHPKYFINPYTGVPGYTSCGKCIACKSQHNIHWVERLERERRCWPYTVFFTLTYDNKYQSRLTLLPSGDLVDLGRYTRTLSTNGELRIDTEYTGECISSDQIELLNLSSEDTEYLYRRRSFDYVQISDVQKFIKRIRYYAYKYAQEKQENSCVRYFIASEVGPSTLRSHIHGLLFFSSENVFKHFDEIINKSWKLSNQNINWSSVTGSASSYTASYCNSINGLPSFYQLRPLRPFVLCSKNPAIGTIDPPGEKIEIEKVIDNLTTTFLLPRRKSIELVSVPLWRELYNKYFPKITGFNRVSDSHRIALYGISSIFPFWNFKQFFRWFNSSPLDSDVSIFSNSFVSHLPHVYRDSQKILSTKYFHHYIHSLLDPLCLNVDSIKRIWYVSKRVFNLASCYGYSISEYVKKIVSFYKKLDYERLKGYFSFQQSFSQINHYDLRSWISVDSLFIRTVSQFRSSRIAFPKWIRYTLSSFGINPFKCFTDDNYFHSFTSSKESLDYFKNLHDVYQDSHKNKQKKEYLLRHPELSYLVYNNSSKFIYHGN